MAFKIKRKPRLPKREIKTNAIFITDFSNIKQLVQYLEAKNISLEEVAIEWNNGNELVIQWDEPESDTSFQIRMDNYEKDLKKWNEWYEASELPHLNLRLR